ncbi:MAG: glycosyltransferase family 39 protein [Myxococcota bacterium]
MTATATRREWITPAALVLLALLVRVVRTAQTAVMMNDGPEFIRLAQQISAGDWRAALSHKYHPLYPSAIAAAHLLTSDWESAAVAISIAGGALAVAALYALLREGFDRRVAAVGAFLLAVQPVAIEITDAQSDPLYLALFLASAALLLRAVQRESAGSALAAGLAAGAAYLARPEGFGTVVAGVGLAGFELARRHWTVSQALRSAAPLCAGAALVMSPYVTYLSIHAGELTLTGKKSVTHMLGVSDARDAAAPKVDPLLAAHPELQPLPRGVHPFRNAPAPAGAATLTFAAGLLLREIFKALRPEGLFLLALGLWAARGAPARRGYFFAAYAIVYGVVFFGLAATSDYLSRRHVLPPASLFLGYAGVGVLALADGLGRVPALAARPALRLALPLALVAALGLGKSLRPDRLDALPERRAAAWILSDGGLRGGEAVAAVKQRVGYYAHARFVDLRRAPHPDVLLEYLHRERVRYVVVDEHERDELLRLNHGSPDALALVRHEALGRHEAFVFELRG